MDIKFSHNPQHLGLYRVEALTPEGEVWLQDRANGVDLDSLSGPQARELEAQAQLDYIETEGDV